jgi:isopenicillin N synthase-like dioxygenase
MSRPGSAARAPRGVLDVPVVDVGAFRTGDGTTRAAIAAQLDEAARTVGFMQVVGHGIPADVEAGLVSAMDGFFGLPMWQKKASRPGMTELNPGCCPPRDACSGAG